MRDPVMPKNNSNAPSAASNKSSQGRVRKIFRGQMDCDLRTSSQISKFQGFHLQIEHSEPLSLQR